VDREHENDGDAGIATSTIGGFIGLGSGPRSGKCLRRTHGTSRSEENLKEDPQSEPDRVPDTWLIEAKLDEDIVDWENVRLDFRFPEIQAEIIESSMSEPNRFTLRTRGRSPLQGGFH
jgi:hypothetical protein